jgi:hypothetical protein
MIVSDYFRGTDREDFAAAVEVFRRHARFRLGVGRSHCKVIAARFADCCYIASGSGNLRSNRNWENCDATYDDGTLFRFYADFAADLLKGQN